MGRGTVIESSKDPQALFTLLEDPKGSGDPYGVAANPSGRGDKKPCGGLTLRKASYQSYLSLLTFSIAACAAASLATGTRNGEQET